MKGIYCLVIFLKNEKEIRIGKKSISFPKGYYCYVGSALNNLEKRIDRHLRKKKKFHWHIDYFLKEAKITGFRIKKYFEDECWVSKQIEKIGGIIIMKGFGSSDCSCKTHLYYFSKNPLKNKKFNKLF